MIDYVSKTCKLCDLKKYYSRKDNKWRELKGYTYKHYNNSWQYSIVVNICDLCISEFKLFPPAEVKEVIVEKIVEKEVIKEIIKIETVEKPCNKPHNIPCNKLHFEEDKIGISQEEYEQLKFFRGNSLCQWLYKHLSS